MKRFNNESNDNNFTKRQKVEETDPWADDDSLDDAEIDALILSQQTKNNINDTSILPTYNNFGQNRIVTSTQFVVQQSQAQILSNKYEAELVLTRDELQKIKEKLELERKETVRVNTELSLKTLENINLKQTINKLRKNVATEANLTQLAANLAQTSSKSNKIEVIEKKCYPLQKISEFIFEPIEDDVCLKLNACDEKKVHLLKSKDVLEVIDDLKPIKTFTLSCIFDEIKSLMGRSQYELNKNEVNSHINKIYLVACELMYNLRKHLEIIERHIQKEDITKFDQIYLNTNEFFSYPTNISLFSAKRINSNECGLECRQVLTLLATLIPYNKQLNKLILGDCKATFSLNVTFMNDYQSLLHYLLAVIEMIGRTRLINRYTGILAAICKLLETIYSINFTFNDNQNELLLKMIKELIYCRCNNYIIKYFTKFLTIATNNSYIVNNLCQQQSGNCIEENLKEGVAIISKDCCFFQLYLHLYRDMCIKNASCIDEIDVYYNLLRTGLNIFSFNPHWTYFVANKNYECLLQLTTLILEVINLLIYDRRDMCDKYGFSLCFTAMNAINYRSFDLFKNYFTLNAKNYNLLKNFQNNYAVYGLEATIVGAIDKLLNNLLEKNAEIDWMRLEKLKLWENL